MTKAKRDDGEPTPSPKDRAPPWGQGRRLEFIDFRLRWDGRINRSDLTTHFGISVPQASTDISTYIGLADSNLYYDRSERVYLATEKFTPLFEASSTANYLRDLLASSMGITPAGVSYLGWAPEVAWASTPQRAVPESVLVATIKAIRARRSIHVLYQSMSHPKPAWREISPIGLGHDGLRWHTRAYCHKRSAFRDFVFARALEVREGAPSDVQQADDAAWAGLVKLVLVPAPGLNAAKRRVIELDYGMVDGQAILEVRAAMLYYVLLRLGLSKEQPTRPEAQQIVLKNEEEVMSVARELAKSYG